MTARPRPGRRRHARSTGGCSSGCWRSSATRPSRPPTVARRSDVLRDADAEPVDVVLLDIVMPVMDGYETLAALKADDDLRDLPVIVISGVDELASVVRCIQMGATDYLPKTVDPEILRARIEASMRPEAAARPRARDARASRRSCWRPSTASGPSCRASCRRRSRRSSRARTARRCWPAIAARSRRCSATCATSPPSPRPPSPRRSSASCATTTRLMGPLIVEHEGTLEHFAGDGFMTFFNDPGPPARPRRPRRRHGGRDARPHSPGSPADWRKRGHVLEIGIGIATGYATLGRIGFEGRYDYGAIGHVDHPRRAPERRGGARRDPHRATDLRRGRGRDHRRRARRRAHPQGLQPAGPGLRGIRACATARRCAT